jgi:hypothetical protein
MPPMIPETYDLAFCDMGHPWADVPHDTPHPRRYLICSLRIVIELVDIVHGLWHMIERFLTSPFVFL